MSAAPALGEVALANLATLKKRHPQAFAALPRQRLLTVLVPLAVVGLAVFAMVWLDFSLTRIINGAHRLADFAVLMLPPSPEGRFVAFAPRLEQQRDILR